MTNPERRQTSRTAIAGHAYINIEPNNGGIVLNVSDEGLCFHSFDPVQRNGKVRFWFAGRDRRIEADAALAWTDETHKGGLRFTALPPEAREQIHNWMSQPTTPSAVGNAVAATGSRPHAFPTPRVRRQDVEATSADSAPVTMVSPTVKEATRLSGFARGLVTGLLVSAAVIAVFMFQSYRREFGETLIRLGERFAAKPSAQAVAVPQSSPARPTVPATVLSPPVPQVDLPAAASPDSLSKKTPPQPDKREMQSDKLRAQVEKVAPLRQSLPTPTAPAQAKLELAKPTAVPATAVVNTPAPKVPTTASAAAILSPTPAPSPSTVASASNSVASRVTPVPKVEAKQPEVQTESSAAENAASTSELFFDVGKFKNQSQAHVEINKLAQLGFPATAVQKGFLWTNSYHILVGPYSDEERAKVTHQNLVSSGFKPRPFERGSRAFTLNSPVTLNGARTPAGDYVISWESSLDEASVKLLHNDSVVATANGRWVKRDLKYARDAYVYRRNADGSRTLIEVRFGGTRQALVFGKSS
jgi:hypothetical protein